MELNIIEKIPNYQLSPNEDYMNEHQRKHFKTALLQWKNTITEKNINAKTQLQSETFPPADLSDRASLEEEFTLKLKSRDREQKLVAKINTALNRIANDNFGYCEKCDAQIGLARLEVRPTAELCIDCKEIEEKREKTAKMSGEYRRKSKIL